MDFFQHRSVEITQNILNTNKSYIRLHAEARLSTLATYGKDKPLKL